MLKSFAALALILATPAIAQAYDRTDLVRGVCRPDGCDEFAIVSVSPMADGGDGTLMRTRVKTFRANATGRRELSEENGYVFCSPTRPAIVAEKDGHTMAFYLAPFATTESPEATRRNMNFYALYFSLCHGMEAGRAAARDLPGTAHDLGYHVALSQSKYASLSNVEDVLSTSPRRPAEARNDTHPIPPRDVPYAVSRRDQYAGDPVDAFAEPRQVRRAPPPPYEMEPDDGWFAGPRGLTSRAFDAFGEVEDWVMRRRY